jgi:hypothetical protein
VTTQGFEAIASLLKELLSDCPVCNIDLSGHRFAQIALTSATEENKSAVQELISHVRKREWAELKKFVDFRSTQDALVVYLIAGPHAGGAVVLVRDPFELYESAELYLLEKPNPDELEALVQMIPAQDWKYF